MDLPELVARFRLEQDGVNHASSSLVIHTAATSMPLPIYVRWDGWLEVLELGRAPLSRKHHSDPGPVPKGHGTRSGLG
jgi:hypothetical protein